MSMSLKLYLKDTEKKKQPHQLSGAGLESRTPEVAIGLRMPMRLLQRSRNRIPNRMRLPTVHSVAL